MADCVRVDMCTVVCKAVLLFLGRGGVHTHYQPPSRLLPPILPPHSFGGRVSDIEESGHQRSYNNRSPYRRPQTSDGQRRRQQRAYHLASSNVRTARCVERNTRTAATTTAALPQQVGHVTSLLAGLSTSGCTSAKSATGRPGGAPPGPGLARALPAGRPARRPPPQAAVRTLPAGPLPATLRQQFDVRRVDVCQTLHFGQQPVRYELSAQLSGAGWQLWQT